MDIDKLKALALAANELPDTMQPFVSSTGQVAVCTFSLKGEQLHTVGNFYDAANPATVLELIAEVEKLRNQLDLVLPPTRGTGSRQESTRRGDA